VILDVVFNHTAEGNERGPTLCFHGLDNGALLPSGRHRNRYVDATGTGNTFDADLVAGWGRYARARDPERKASAASGPCGSWLRARPRFVRRR
jgi:hypothetical protein